MTAVVGQVIVSEGFHLLGGGGDQALLSEAQRETPKSGHSLNVLVSVCVFDPHPPATIHYERTTFEMGLQIGQTVNYGSLIAGFDGIRPQRILGAHAVRRSQFEFPTILPVERSGRMARHQMLTPISKC